MDTIISMGINGNMSWYFSINYWIIYKFWRASSLAICVFFDTIFSCWIKAWSFVAFAFTIIVIVWIWFIRTIVTLVIIIRVGLESGILDTISIPKLSYEFKQIKIYSDIPRFGGLSESVLSSSSGSGFGCFPESSSPPVPLSISGPGLLPLLESSSLALLSLLPAMRETQIIRHWIL